MPANKKEQPLRIGCSFYLIAFIFMSSKLIYAIKTKLPKKAKPENTAIVVMSANLKSLSITTPCYCVVTKN